jgi:hypothetical protein
MHSRTRSPYRLKGLLGEWCIQIALGTTVAAPLAAAPSEVTTAINMLDYWPQLAPGTVMIKHISTDFYGKPFEGLRSIYSPKSGTSFTKRDYIIRAKSKPKLNDTWHLKREGDRLIEFRDDVSIAGHAQLVRIVYQAGREIHWGGNYETVPGRDTVFSHMLVDTKLSDPSIQASSPNRFGYAATKLEAVLPNFTAGPYSYQNVAVVHHYQATCLDKACDARGPVYNAKGKQIGGAQSWELRYWLAPNKGIIQTQYLKTTTSRIDAAAGRIDYVSKMCVGPTPQDVCSAE